MMTEVDEEKLSKPGGRDRYSLLAVRLFQTEIAKVRIRNALEILVVPDFEYDALVSRIAHLDTETYYTVAFDVLKLVASFLPEGRAAAFKKEPTYATFAQIRSDLIRHPWKNGTEDPYSGFALDGAKGLILKGGSPYGKFCDPGFYANSEAFDELLKIHGVQTPRTYTDRDELQSWTKALSASAGIPRRVS